MSADRQIKIAPSILSADFARLGEHIARVEAAGADLIHVDVMDGHFVPNLTLGPLVVRAVRKVTTLPLDVHLMIDNPEDFVDEFVSAGADMISVHVEAAKHLHRLVQSIRKHPGVKAGVALNPASPATRISPVLGDLDFVLVMSVNPGFGGQEFIPSALEKIELLSGMIAGRGGGIEIEVDGGVGPLTAQSVIGAGAGILVAGSAVFDAPDIGDAIRTLKSAASV